MVVTATGRNKHAIKSLSPGNHVSVNRRVLYPSPGGIPSVMDRMGRSHLKKGLFSRVKAKRVKNFARRKRVR